MTRACFLLALAAVCAQGGDWPQFRGPGASGVSDGQKAPLSWNAESGEGIVWKTPIPGLSVASPIAWGERIFLVTAVSGDDSQTFRTGLYGDTDPVDDSSKHVWKVMALHRNTGKIVWDRTAHEGQPKTKRHPKSSQASPTPATNGEVVVAYFGSEGLYAYSVEGELLWKKDLGNQNAGWFFDPGSEWGAASSPVIHGDSVIVQCDRQQDSFIAAFDLQTGRELWRTPREEIPTWGTPTVVPTEDGAEIVTNGAKAIRSYDAESGELLWKLGPNSEVTCTTPVAAHGLVFVTAGYPPVRPIYAVKQGSRGDLTLGKDETSSDAIAWSNKRGVYLPSPIVVGEHLYTLANNGILACYRAKTGENVYRERVGAGSFSAAPVAAAGKLYLSSEDGDIYVVKAGPVFESLGKNPMGEILMATPAFSDDLMIVRGHKSLFAIR